ncbi:MAG: lipid-A-disaccharide synthase [Sedimentisphaerales bacterium]|nr:lipid-A-disaccharide synthase [Sedimentisphaerales bacterium]
MNDTAETIFISAAEVSGDMHAAKLIRQLRQTQPNVRCVGLGGPEMAGQGCELLEDLVGRSAMLTHALAQIGFYWKLRKRVRKYFRENHVDTVVLVDSPAWNFHVAKAAKRQGIRVVYYIAPQLWAWGGWRIGKLRRCVDKVACILPFEQEWFRQRRVDAEYVGHPLFDHAEDIAASESELWQNKEFPRITLLPGSRKHEIAKLWQPMLRVAEQIKARFPQACFLAVANNETTADELKRECPAELDLRIQCCSIAQACADADLTLVASGTATLEVAGAQCPMVVMYDVSRWQWYLVGRWLIKTKYLCLVNILAQRELVPEFMPVLPKTQVLAQTAIGLLSDENLQQKTRAELTDLMNPLKKTGASRRVAEMVLRNSSLLD